MPVYERRVGGIGERQTGAGRVVGVCFVQAERCGHEQRRSRPLDRFHQKKRRARGGGGLYRRHSFRLQFRRPQAEHEVSHPLGAKYAVEPPAVLEKSSRRRTKIGDGAGYFMPC